MPYHTLTSMSRRRLFRWSLVCLLIVAATTGCSRSAWMKKDGREVSPSEQLVCAEQVKTENPGRKLLDDELKSQIESCMVAKGYHRRPWWLLNDLHWNVNSP